MRTSLKLMIAAATGFGGTSLAAQPVSAMPMSGLDPALATASDEAKNVENARWICGPWGCRWVPGWRPWWGPGPYWGSRGRYGWGYGPWHRRYGGWYGPRAYGYW